MKNKLNNQGKKKNSGAAAKEAKAAKAAFAGAAKNAREGQGGQGAQGTQGAGVRLIKKYNNRRLYDSQNSCYIKLDELKEMILNGEEFRVLNVSGEDVTSQTLISILLSEELMGQPIFSEQMLRNMVMFTQGPMRGPMLAFLEQCLPLFMQGNRQLLERFGGRLGAKEMESLVVLQSNMIRQMMEQYVFRGLENYLSTQKSMEKFMSLSDPFNFKNFLLPRDSKRPSDSASEE